jgi:hypothetical protein
MARQQSRPRPRKQRRKRAAAELPAGGQPPRHAGSVGPSNSRSRVATDPLLGTVGERPSGPFGPVPVSEFAIFAGIVALIVGLITQGGNATDVGALVCALGVAEITAREHFSGFRSHTLLLALMPAIGLEALIALEFGAPSNRILLLVPVVPVFLICAWLLRRKFRVARHARLVRYR